MFWYKIVTNHSGKRMKQVDNLLLHCLFFLVIKKGSSIIILNAITHVDMVYMNKDCLCAYFERLGHYSISYGSSSWLYPRWQQGQSLYNTRCNIDWNSWLRVISTPLLIADLLLLVSAKALVLWKALKTTQTQANKALHTLHSLSDLRGITWNGVKEDTFISCKSAELQCL